MIHKQPPEVFLRKGVLKIYGKFTGDNPWQSVISIKLLSNLIEIALRHGCSPVNFLHSFRTPFPRNTSGWLLLAIINIDFEPCKLLHSSQLFGQTTRQILSNFENISNFQGWGLTKLLIKKISIFDFSETFMGNVVKLNNKLTLGLLCKKNAHKNRLH